MRKFILALFFISISFGLYAQQLLSEKNNSYGLQLLRQNAEALHLAPQTLQNLRISSCYYDRISKAWLVYVQQTYKGIDIENAISTLAFKNEKPVSIAFNLIQNTDLEKAIASNVIQPVIVPADAMRNAANAVQVALNKTGFIPLHQSADGQAFEFDKGNFAVNNVTVKLMWSAPADSGKLHLSWAVMLHTLKGNNLWNIQVDALNGSILKKNNLTAQCNWTPKNLHKLSCIPFIQPEDNILGIQSVGTASYNVIPFPYEDPQHSLPVLVTDPWNIFPNTDATTLKWNSDGAKDYDSTRGNNVYAQPDEDGKDNTQKNAARSLTPLPNLNFNYSYDFNKDPLDATTSNRDFAITNLFYWNNIMHDLSYQYGFDEVSGNFQQNNLSRGGKDSDYVIADGLDASGTNNANFATPADGSKPRMQMFLWDPSKVNVTQTLEVLTPSDLQGWKPAMESQFSTKNKLIDKGPITGKVVLYKDRDIVQNHLACDTAYNLSELAGNIAYIDRGTCNFVAKVKNAQIAGAIAAIVGDNVPNSPIIIMGGTDNTITIPAVSTTYEMADSIKQAIALGKEVNVTLHAAPRMDGDLDNGVISHEYTHGISNRLTGGPNNISCLQNKEQMGEGWSDYVALMVTTNWAAAHVSDGALPRAVGNYAYGLTPEYSGIRYYPYSTDFSINPWTYDSLRESSLFSNNLLKYDSHIVGEVWCEMLWEMTWEIIKAVQQINPNFQDASQLGGNTIAMQLVMEGMRLQKCSPGFVDGRDAILKADTLLYGGAYSPAIWHAFARRGLGYGADQGNNNNIKDGTASYTLPSILPVIWGNFTAQKINKTALLKWTTLSEENTDRFIVERSADGINYNEVGIVKAAGNSVVAQSYSFTDTKPLKGNNIYRIKLIDNESKYKYSEERSLNFEDISYSISIAPNPAHNYVVVRIPGNTQNVQIVLYSTAGQKIGSYTMNAEVSSPIDVSKLPAGVYYISLLGNEINEKQKIVVK